MNPTGPIPRSTATWTTPATCGGGGDRHEERDRHARGHDGPARARGLQTAGDLWFVAQADEEDGCYEVGLKWLRDARPEIGSDFSIDEGGGIRQELTDGRVMVPIIVGEKATLPVLLTAVGTAGHASIPGASDNAVLCLATLLGRIGRYRPRRSLLPETRRLLETLIGPLGDDLDRDLDRAVALEPGSRHDLLALFATTIAPTRLRGRARRECNPRQGLCRA